MSDLGLLKAILRTQQSRFIYIPDKEQFGVVDHWPESINIPDPPEILRGDCDDFALACRKQLRALEIKSKLILCRTESKEYHLVCSVAGWILDNRARTVRNKSDIPYDWIKMSGYEKGDQWYYIK